MSANANDTERQTIKLAALIIAPPDDCRNCLTQQVQVVDMVFSDATLVGLYVCPDCSYSWRQPWQLILKS